MTSTIIMDLPTQEQGPGILQADFIGAFTPLDDQFGVLEKAYLPDGLEDVVFVSGTFTYAVIDSAAVPGIINLAEADGLEARCLFTGDMEDDLGEVAPWIISLRPKTALTRYLFTEGRGPWQLWRKPPILLVQTAASLDDLRAHLRKFTRVRTEDGAWLFFRFWEPPVLRTLRKDALKSELFARLLGEHRFLHPDRGADGVGLWSLHRTEAS